MGKTLSQPQAQYRVPDHVPSALVVDFDACNDAGMAVNVFDRLDELRGNAPPIAWSPYNGGHWMVFREGDIQAILTTPEAFTTAHLSAASTMRGGPPMIPLGLEPPEHAPWRNVLMKYFGPTKIKQLEGVVRSRAEDLISRVAQKDRCEFVSEVAEPMPITIFMEMMGLPLEQFPEFRSLALRILDPEGLYDPAEQEARAGANAQVMAMLGAVIADRHENPKDDLVSSLIGETVQGKPIGPQELLSVCYVLFLGGLDTVTNAMSFGMRYLALDPALQADLRKHPEHIKEIAEWLLRRSAFVNVQRSVRQDTVFEGIAMKQGDMVWNIAWSGSNKLGEDDRSARHLAFGYGHHLCLGMHLARLELRLMYETWFGRIGAFSLPAAEPSVMAGGPIMHMKRLPLLLEPRASTLI
jgi:cytochrome P450